VVFIFYIKEASNINEIINFSFKLPNFLKKFVFVFLKIFNLILVKKNVIILPYLDAHQISTRKQIKLANKIGDLLEKENAANIALSKYLIRNTHFKNYFHSKNIHVLNGRWLFQYLSLEILSYISKNMESKKVSDLEVAILANTYNTTIKDIISEISQNVKVLNIATNNLANFKSTTAELYEKFGISIRVSNNRKKVLQKADVILNFDFSEEVINKYSLPEKAVIINFSNKINIESKLFNGININYYNISVASSITSLFNKLNLSSSFPLEILYESMHYGKKSFTDIMNSLNADKVYIKSLIGNKGQINPKKFKTE